jgi:hypothetical protein
MSYCSNSLDHGPETYIKWDFDHDGSNFRYFTFHLFVKLLEIQGLLNPYLVVISSTFPKKKKILVPASQVVHLVIFKLTTSWNKRFSPIISFTECTGFESQDKTHAYLKVL